MSLESGDAWAKYTPDTGHLAGAVGDLPVVDILGVDQDRPGGYPGGDLCRVAFFPGFPGAYPRFPLV